eukprot:COSAG06_NODE_2762_length_6327_cov_5.664740_6_plen_241_part_00
MCFLGAGSGSVTASLTDDGPDAGWFTAGYESGGLGLGTADDRLLNIGWAVGMGFDPLHMKRGGDKSGGLTVPRVLNFDAGTGAVVANPVPELVTLRNATLANESDVHLAPLSVHAVAGTGGGAAAAADIEVAFALPADGAAAFSVSVLSNLGYLSRVELASHGVTVRVDVSAPAADGSRTGTAEIVSHGAAACNPGSPFCTPNSTAPETHDGQSPLTAFKVLPDERELELRVLVDRIIVE